LVERKPALYGVGVLYEPVGGGAMSGLEADLGADDSGDWVDGEETGVVIIVRKTVPNLSVQLGVFVGGSYYQHNLGHTRTVIIHMYSFIYSFGPSIIHR